MLFKRLTVFTLFLICGLSIFNRAQATHLRAGEIIVERVNCQASTFRITIIAFTDCEPDNPVLFGEGELYFGDGSDPILLPQIQNISRSDLGDGVCTASYTTEHTYSSPGTYKVGYVEANRNAGVLNMSNSIETTFYVETEINIEPFLGCNNSPVLQIPPIDRGCTGVAFFHNPGAYDPDGDSLAFELVVPKKSVGTVVDGYVDPNNNSFYENFGEGNENANGEPTFSINPVTGDLKWDSPGTVGEYNIAFIVKEYRKINGQYYSIGYVTRDMQIIVEDCDNKRPELEIPEDICVEAGTLIDETILGTDPDNDDVKIEAFSPIFEIGASVTPNDGSYQPSVPPAELNFTWQTECLDVREMPYEVFFKITDNPPLGPQLVSFDTWQITVIGPSPEVTTLVQEGQGLRLNWDDYICDNAETMQVWRRVDSNAYLPDDCETGIRENAGYSLVNDLPISSTTFKDNNLAAAAKYCYRLVATFPDTESVVSEEICFEFVPAETPIITHVSVEKTDLNNGEVVVAWREPFELGTLTPPLTFKVYRADGFSGNANLTQVGTDIVIPNLDPVNTDSTTLSIVDTGLNTRDNVYNYRVAIVDPSGAGGGEEIFSAVASTVRLEPTPQVGQIQIDWSAMVPWTNSIASPPGSEHLIYRGLEGDEDDELEFLAKVDVIQNGFRYVDSDNLEDDQIYCYKVLTKGTYGNPDIASPLYNFSQMVCAQPSDTIPPCKLTINVTGPSCEELAGQLCSSTTNNYLNTLSWSANVEGECQDDILEYELYFADQVGSAFDLIATVRDTFFIHQKSNSYKGCYQVKAIDRSGNESELSDVFCVDNCPNYELPNIITPNGDNCNDTFRAYGAEDSNCFDSGQADPTQCARFVESVKFTVYNRWGQEVYSYEGFQGSENDIFINWNGQNNDGVEIASGVYYYLAEVIFDVVDPANAKQDIKGWIHVVR